MSSWKSSLHKELLLPCHDAPSKSTLETHNHFYFLVLEGIWLPNAEQRLCRACRAYLHLDNAVSENQVGFCPIQSDFAEGEGIHHSVAELDTHCSPQPRVSEVAAEIVQFSCWCCIFSFSPFLLWPLVVSGWMQRRQEWEWEPGPRRLLTSPWIQRPSDNILVDTVGWGCTRLLGKDELLQFPLLPLYFQHPEPWASTQQQGITFKEAAPASGSLVLDPQTSSRKEAHGAALLVHCQKCN